MAAIFASLPATTSSRRTTLNRVRLTFSQPRLRATNSHMSSVTMPGSANPAPTTLQPRRLSRLSNGKVIASSLAKISYGSVPVISSLTHSRPRVSPFRSSARQP